eukprot:Colp12_sorted_trinity150504_noHs@4636
MLTIREDVFNEGLAPSPSASSASKPPKRARKVADGEEAEVKPKKPKVAKKKKSENVSPEAKSTANVEAMMDAKTIVLTPISLDNDATQASESNQEFPGFEESFRAWRRANKVTQLEVGKAVGYDQSTISHFESGSKEGDARKTFIHLLLTFMDNFQKTKNGELPSAVVPKKAKEAKEAIEVKPAIDADPADTTTLANESSIFPTIPDLL